VTGAVATSDPTLIRELLRDTALEVSLLAQGGRAIDIESLRRQCEGLVETFERELTARGVATDVRQEIVYAQCALIDETVLTKWPEADKSKWDSQPLHVVKFGDADAGNRVFANLEARMREPSANLALLVGYAAILGLGFKGRYALGGDKERAALTYRLDAQIATYLPPGDGNFVIDSGAARPWWRFWASLSPWAVAGLAAVAALIVYFFFRGSLDARLAYLAEHTR
jgi:type VI secretion system protein ImpK